MVKCVRTFFNSGFNHHVNFVCSRGADDKRFPCSVCQAKFASPRDVRSHMKTHGPKQTWKCEQCPAVCGSKKALRDHVRGTHATHEEEGLNFRCLECGKGFLKQSYLEVSHIDSSSLSPDTSTIFSRITTIASTSPSNSLPACSVRSVARPVRTSSVTWPLTEARPSSSAGSVRGRSSTGPRSRSTRGATSERSRERKLCHCVRRPQFYYQRAISSSSYRCIPCNKAFGLYGVLRKHQKSHQRKVAI